ncbi:hypothetical protein [Streptomyces muensis]|uniref:Uncharacterized protein n=2 Tax=Streptomyces TaxID=1883 RepID=A0A9X1PTT0_STRM4|nr:hypothetical protein [Streptomyces muensis]MCF1592414.1 hypothetical protein [Streptomyces muensis]
MPTMPFSEFFANLIAEHATDPPAPEPVPPPAVTVELVPVDPDVPSAHVAYAFNPHEGARSQANYHLRLDQDLNAGRLVRKRGDALCKPQAKFWGLEPTRPADRRAPSCPTCIERAERYGITVRQAA